MAKTSRVNLDGDKKWYQSEGVIGGAVSIASLIAGAFGYVVGPDDQAAIAVIIMGIGGTIGSIAGIHGRIKATKKIS